MSLIAQQISNLLEGVSQLPQEQRSPSQAQEQKNGLSSVARGLMKRPPKIHLGKLTATITGWASSFIHTINRDETERYHVVIANGDIFVYDVLTCTPVTVIKSLGVESYLDDSAGKGFRATTAGDNTIIVNRGITVKQGTTKAPAARHEALLYLRQADYGTTYAVTLNGVAVSITTAVASTPASRNQITTEQVALALCQKLTLEPLLTDFDFTLLGSSVYATRTDGLDFTIAANDGLADSGLKIIKDTVQAFADLPRKAPHGFVVEVTGDPESDTDNYWVKFDDGKLEYKGHLFGPLEGELDQPGVWKECPQPGTVIDFLQSTMPHNLQRKGHIVENTPHVGVPTVPSANVVEIAPGSITSKNWDYTEPGDVVPSGGLTKLTMRDQGNGVKLTTGVAVTKTYIPISVDTTLVDPGNDLKVECRVNGVAVATYTQAAGQSPIEGQPPLGPDGLPVGNYLRLFGQHTFELSGLTNTAVIELYVSYAWNFTPNQFRRGIVTVPRAIDLITSAKQEIRFSATDVYPVGDVVTVTIGGVPFVYTVTGTAKTGAQIATALQPTIDANASIIAAIGTTAQSIAISLTSGLVPTIVISSVFDQTKKFFNPSLAMVTDEHIGHILTNVTDGSTGTITGNTDQIITVAALAGGVDNSFHDGDIITLSSSGRYFVFHPNLWETRGAGGLKFCGFPSFTNNTIADAVFYQNRLGFISGENVVFSAAGNLFRFFRQTASQLLADDMIDVRAANRSIALFHGFAVWNEGLYGISDNGQFSISGEPALAPSTIRIDLVSSVPNSSGAAPFVGGNRLYLTRGKGGFTQVQEVSVRPNQVGSSIIDHVDISKDVSRYIKGSPLALVGDDSVGFLAVLTNDAGAKNLYVFSYYFGDDDHSRIQSAWSRWEFPDGQIVGIDMVDGKLGIVSVHSDGAYLSYVDLNVALDTVDPDEGAQYLDRRLSESTSGVSSVYAGGTTTWTLPYSVATDGSQGTLVVMKRSPLTLLGTARPAANQISAVGDYTAASVYIGVLYEFRYKFSRIFFRYKDEKPETRGRLAMHYIDVHYRDTTGFDVVVTPVGRAARTQTVALSAPAEGRERVSIHCKNDQVTIELVNNTPGVCSFTSLDWEGYFSTRDKRV